MQCCICWNESNLINLECHHSHNLCLSCLDETVYKPIIRDEEPTTDCPLCRKNFSHTLRYSIRNALLPTLEKMFLKGCIIFIISCWSMIFVRNTQVYLSTFRDSSSDEPIHYYLVVENFRYQILLESVISFFITFLCILCLYKTSFYNLVICKTLIFLHCAFLIFNPLFYIEGKKVVPLLFTLYRIYEFRNLVLLFSQSIYFLHFSILF